MPVIEAPTIIAVTGAEALAYMRAGLPYSHRTTMSLEAEAAAPVLPMIRYEGDPAELTGTVWARCELVLRSGDALAAESGQEVEAAAG